ncbi:MAG: GTPase HflX [Spirochaetes bacterium]|nr:GTPase HflX [Spirochaetota bacterium]
MFESFNFDQSRTAIIVSLQLPSISNQDCKLSCEELTLLAKTLGVTISEVFVQKRRSAEPGYYIGKGKLEQIKEFVIANKIETVFFDNELTGIQARNLEKYLGIPIFGRTEIILNIFQKRARTNEAKLQVQLASLEYMLPRLKNRWDHFSRVQGGIGLRGGEGEKQLELDRRMIKEQIKRIKIKLNKVDVQMKNRRKRRKEHNLISLVGYTNAGKTSLLNKLTRQKQLAQNMLFSTIDSNIKKVYIDPGLTILLNDTVGFINKLPHGLVASFRSTLDEIKSSKLILHVIDASSPYIQTQIQSVNQVLEEIEVHDIPIARVFNKMDKIDHEHLDIQTNINEEDLLVSAHTGAGLESLKDKIKEHFLILSEIN